MRSTAHAAEIVRGAGAQSDRKQARRQASHNVRLLSH